MEKMESNIPYSDLTAESQETQQPPPPYVGLHVQQGPICVGPKSQRLICPSCKADISTQVRHATTTRTHLIALLLCVFSCWLCVCCPYLMDSCRNTNHYCPNCDCFIGSYSS